MQQSYLLYLLAQAHIDDLHADAQRQRLIRAASANHKQSDEPTARPQRRRLRRFAFRTQPCEAC